ncbi:TPA: peptidase [Kluyvera cryocrescens]|nr:peptidase [Kluyvera cryocrescens]
MKNKVMNVIFQLAWVALLVITLCFPRSAAPVVLAALVWVACFFFWLIAVVCAVGWFAGGRAREEVLGALALLKKIPSNPVRRWGTRLLIILGLACSGWFITLVFYHLTLVMYQIARVQLAEPVVA